VSHPLVEQRQVDSLQAVRVTGSRLTKGRALSDAELVALLGRCDAIGGVKGSMLRGVLLVGVAGLRISELCYSPVTKRGLRVDSVSPLDGHLHVVGKGNKENACVLDVVTRRALDAWLDVRRGLPWRHIALFGTPSRGRILRPNWLWKMLERLAKGAGVPRFSPHDLRRTFATRMLDRLDLREVQILMVHADPKTTGKYDKRSAETLAAKRRAVTVFDPGGR
jgi:integrase/recombinase XerD